MSQHAMPELPRDILLKVFHEVFPPPFYLIQDHWCGGYFIPIDNPVFVARKSLHNIANITLVCKSWNAVATEILFSRVVIRNEEALRKFSAVLVESPPLGLFVKGIWLSMRPLGPSKSSDITLNIHRGRNADSVEELFPAALRYCIFIQTLVLDIDLTKHSSGFISWNNAFLQRSLLADRLRILSVYYNLSTTARMDVMPSNMVLSRLEELTLCWTIFPMRYTFPVLAHCHTLRLISTTIDLKNAASEQEMLSISSISFPSLKRLCVHGSLDPIEVDDQCLEGLESLHLVGWLSRKIYELWEERSDEIGDDLQELHLELEYPIRRLPHRSLRTLVVYGLQGPQIYGYYGIEDPYVGNLRNLHSSLVRHLPRCTLFSKLVIKLGPVARPVVEVFHMVMGEIKRMCDSRGVLLQVEVFHVGQYVDYLV
ncbi:hypothetical protein NLI96_g10019 [Meripilus lineatus]|uniref:F-box domain-containing protein n=1 Tax=Meripilus lineatus TaxID=2056292 RepID=A0AAD5YER8_9APHY|nr:hypothetical protein NLI96_g10019 [Physisporinus lineatus]